MGEMKIDLNRGVTIRTEASSGIRVYMYKDSPGVYFNEYEVEVSEKMAKKAGFDVEKFAKKRVMLERKAAAISIINEEFGDLDPSAYSGDGKVEYESGGFKSVYTGFGNYIILDPEGNRMGDKWLNKEQAKRTVMKLAVDEAAAVGDEEEDTAKAA